MSKSRFLASVALATVIFSPGQAHAVDMDPVDECREDIALKISGQVNRAFLYADNGVVDDFFHVDNDNSSTRLRARATGQVDCDFEIGAQIEVQFESNSSADVRFKQSGQASANNFTERKLEIWFDSEAWGTLWLGQGDTASNGTSEVDLSKTGVIGYSGIGDMAGGLEFENGVRIKSVFDNMDGLSRTDRVRYDTPTFAGFQISGSWTDDNEWDVALRFARAFGGHKFAAAASYVDGERGQGFGQDYQISGSASLLFSNGFNLTFAGGMEEDKGAGAAQRNAHFLYGKAGWIFDIFDWGFTAIAADIAYNANVAARGDEAWSYGGYVVQKIDWVGTELYAGVRLHQLDHGGVVTSAPTGVNFLNQLNATSDPRDTIAFMTGARVKF